MRAGDDVVWDQCHILQSGTLHRARTPSDGTTHEVDGWIGQRDHSWGIRDHGRCPLWIWFQIQLDDGFLGVWHWELPNGARVYTDGCWAGADRSEPIPVVDFHHDVRWLGADGAPADYGEHGEAVAGLGGTCAFTLADRRTHHGRGGGHLRPTVRAVPPGRAQPHAVPHRRRPVPAPRSTRSPAPATTTSSRPPRSPARSRASAVVGHGQFCTVSAPPPPVQVSVPPRPSSTFDPASPTRVSLPDDPVMFSNSLMASVSA